MDSDEWETIVCAAHRLQNAIRHGLNASPAVVKLLALSRKMVGHFKHSALTTNALNAKQREMQPRSEPKKVAQDVPTRWNSTYFMLQRLLELRWPLNAVLTDDTLTSRDHRHLCFSNDDWDLAKDLVATLADLEEATRDLSGDSYVHVTISWVYPLMRKLRKRMNAGNKDRPAI